MIDFLVTLSNNFTNSSATSYEIKAGPTYRNLNIDNRDTIPSKRQVDMQAQIGFGYEVSKNSSLKIIIQHIFGKGDTLTVNREEFTGRISGISSQTSLMIGFKSDVL